MASTLKRNDDDVLDILFNHTDGILNPEQSQIRPAIHSHPDQLNGVGVPDGLSMELDDHYPTADLFDLLDGHTLDINNVLADDNGFTPVMDMAMTFDGVVADFPIDTRSQGSDTIDHKKTNHQLDHQYCRSPLGSDGELSVEQMPSPCSETDDAVSSESNSPQPFVDVSQSFYSAELTAYSPSSTVSSDGTVSPDLLSNFSPPGQGIEELYTMDGNKLQAIDPKFLLSDFESIISTMDTKTETMVDINSSEWTLFGKEDIDDDDDDDQIFVTKSSSYCSDTLPFTMDDIDSSTITPQSYNYTELRLSDEEKELLAHQGIVLPTNMPLTKEEERALKGVRRKIRNKISAKESRKRKQGYVEGLEKRVKVCTVQNLHLQKKVENLEKQNISLVTQLKKIQTMLTSSSSKTAQSGTCIMVLLLSFALLVVPNFNLFARNTGQELMPGPTNVPVGGQSRKLLADNVDTADVGQLFSLNHVNAGQSLNTHEQEPPENVKSMDMTRDDMINTNSDQTGQNSEVNTKNEPAAANDTLSENEVKPQGSDILDNNIESHNAMPQSHDFKEKTDWKKAEEVEL